ncbi:sodium/pantothenate symporter [Fulvivirga ligni]|uniref:sodium/pantothenate symporter n=1 Tax=Fulvivirga ligni TaxID=2904246 RepID=UPI001F2FBD8E|nr:sodium:solute symporter [Fulvivirga ligni]UII20888.1 sodium:solute symporter [Fulvivirga ligni]
MDKYPIILGQISVVTATYSLLGVYAMAVLYFVVNGMRKTTNMSDYALGSVQFSPAFVGLSLAASMTSAATFIINPGLIGTYGISGFISYGLALPVAAIFSLVLLTKGFRKFGNKVSALTMAQWMGNRYKNEKFALFFAFLSLLLITFIVLICVGITQVLSKALGLDPAYALAGVIVFVFGYMMFGGANSMVYTNTIQAVSMVIVAIILISSGYEYFEKGVNDFFNKLTAIDPNLTKPLNPESPLFRDYFEIIFCQIVVGIAVVCQPHILTKSLLLKKSTDVNRYLLVGATVQFLFFLVVIAGLYARIEFPDMKIGDTPIAPDGLISTYVVTKFPVYLSIIIIFGLISAGMSTLEGLIQSLSSTITSDIIMKVSPEAFRKKLEDGKAGIMVNKIVIILLAIVSFLFSYQQLINPNMSVAIFAQNGVYAYFSCAFIPVLFGMFLPRANTNAVIIAALSALIIHFGMYYGGITAYMQTTVKNPAIASTAAILGSSIIGILLYFVLPKKQYHDM